MSRHILYTIPTDQRLLEATLTVGTTFTADATNYWTFQLRVMRPGQVYGEAIGDAYSLATFTLTADLAATLYENPRGFKLNEGDRLLIERTSTGSPVALKSQVVELKLINGGA